MVALRPCVPGDVPFLRQVYATTREEERRPLPWTEEQKRGFLDMQFGAQKQHYEEHYPDCAFLVIEVDGKPAGRLYIDRSEDGIHLLDIALLPEYRRRGIGSGLLDEILAEGRRTHRKVIIYVEHYNPARRLYDRLGFRHLDTNGVYHRMEWQPD